MSPEDRDNRPADGSLEAAWREVSVYLDEVLELQGEAREAWLQDLEARAPTIAAQVRAYLVELAQLEKENFLGGNSAFTLAGATLAGQRVGAYTLERMIGHGGMGTVWLAHRSDGRFEGRAAVKFLNAAFLGHPSELRFTREGNVLARLQHPNIAHLIDAGVSGSGQPYLILEYIEGERIDRYCELHQLSIERRIALFLDVLAAVAHAHSHLIVHRDLKPSNIMVTANGVVKLLDFGVAALLAPGADDNAGTPLTREIAAGLTPEYAAPEQLLGDSITTATDVYALGLVLFVLLVGRHPTSGENKTAAEMMRLTLDTEAPRVSQVAIDAKLGRLLQGDLDNIVAMALRKNPAERYSTVELFAQDLRRHLALEPVSARPSSLGYRAGKFIRRHRGSVIAAITIAVVLIGAVVVTTVQMFEAREQREAALAAVSRAEATRDFLQRVLSEFQSSGQRLTPPILLERSSALLKAQYGNQPRFVAEMLIELAREYGELMDKHAAMAMLTEARDIAQLHGYHLLLAKAECAMARREQRTSNTDAVPPHLANAAAALARVDSPDIEVQVECRNAEAEYRGEKHDRSGAIEMMQQSRAMLEEAGLTHKNIYNVVLGGIATRFMDDGRVTEALPLYRLSAEMHARNGRGGTRMHAIAQQNVATALYRLGEVRESEDLRQQLFGEYNVQSSEDLSPTFIINTAGGANRLFRHNRFVDLLPEAVARAERIGDMNNLRLGSVDLARYRLQSGASRADVEAPLVHMESAPGNQPVPLATRLLAEDVRAELAFAEGTESALTTADQRATALLKEYDYPNNKRPPRQNYLVLLLVAKTALAVGDAQRAVEHARAALPLAESMARGPDTSADVGEALLVLGRALIELGRADEARTQLDRAIRCLDSGYGSDHPRSRDARALIANLR